MSGCTVGGGAGGFDAEVSLLALSSVFFFRGGEGRQPIETAAYQLACLSMASWFP